MEVSLDVISGVAMIVPFIVSVVSYPAISKQILQITTLPPPFMKSVTFWTALNC
jgi:hypothetical protein